MGYIETFPLDQKGENIIVLACIRLVCDLPGTAETAWAEMTGAGEAGDGAGGGGRGGGGGGRGGGGGGGREGEGGRSCDIGGEG